MNSLSRRAIVGFLVVFVLTPVGDVEFFGRERMDRAAAQDSVFESKKIVPYVPSPQFVVDKMIDLAGVKPGDLVYDLGSGDGRIVITAAKKGAKAIGFEIDGDLVGESRANIEKAGVEALAEIRHQDILTVDFSAASVVTMYLLPDVNLQLKPKLLSQLKPGARIVSHFLTWAIGYQTKSSGSKVEPFISGQFLGRDVNWVCAANLARDFYITLFSDVQKFPSRITEFSIARFAAALLAQSNGRKPATRSCRDTDAIFEISLRPRLSPSVSFSLERRSAAKIAQRICSRTRRIHRLRPRRRSQTRRTD
jgi:SAM-dependent methyltransferase